MESICKGARPRFVGSPIQFDSERLGLIGKEDSQDGLNQTRP